MSDPEVKTPAPEGTDNAPAPEGDKPKTVPYERLSEMAGQKNAEKERADAAEKKLADMATDQQKVREAKLKKDGEVQTLLDEKTTALETKIADFDAINTKWNAHLARRTESLNGIMEDAKFDDKTKDLAMKYDNLDDRAEFISLFSQQTTKPGVDNRRSSNGVPATDLPPLSKQTPKEREDTWQQRLDGYLK